MLQGKFGNFSQMHFMGRYTSILLGDHFEAFINKAVSSGRFKDSNEVICAGLQLLEEEEAKRNALKNALFEGIESGFVKEFDPQQYLDQLKVSRERSG